MAAKDKEPGTKTVLKPGTICEFMATLGESSDRECFQLSEVLCTKQEVDNLMKAGEEMKDMVKIDFSFNGLADVTALSHLARLTRLNLSNNKIKNMSCFLVGFHFFLIYQLIIELLLSPFYHIFFGYCLL